MPLSTYPLVPWIRTSNCTARCRTSAGKILGLVTGPSSLRVPHLPWRGMDDRAPVMLLSDGYLANGSEPWRVPATADDGTVTAEEKDFWPYRVRDQPAHRLRLPRPVPHRDLPPGRTTHLRRPGPRPDRHRQAQRPRRPPGPPGRGVASGRGMGSPGFSGHSTSGSGTRVHVLAPQVKAREADVRRLEFSSPTRRTKSAGHHRLLHSRGRFRRTIFGDQPPALGSRYSAAGCAARDRRSAPA
jgi:hypothetical protein